MSTSIHMITGFLLLVFLMPPLFVWTLAEWRLAWFAFSVDTCLLNVTSFVESDISEGLDVDFGACPIFFQRFWSLLICTSNLLPLAPLSVECLESHPETFGNVACLLFPLISPLEYLDVLSKACTVKWSSFSVADLCDPCLLIPGRRSFDLDTSRLPMFPDSLSQITRGGIYFSRSFSRCKSLSLIVIVVLKCLALSSSVSIGVVVEIIFCSFSLSSFPFSCVFLVTVSISN